MNVVQRLFANSMECLVNVMHQISRLWWDWLLNLRKTGSVVDIKPLGRPHVSRSAENIAIMSDNVAVSPMKSICWCSQQLNISRTSMKQILKEDLHLWAYKIQLTQELKPNNHEKHWAFANWVLAKQRVDNNFIKKVMFSDEAHFLLNGFVNKQNCKI